VAIYIANEIIESAAICSVYIAQDFCNALSIVAIKLLGHLPGEVIATTAVVIKSAHCIYPQGAKGGACVGAIKPKKCDTSVTRSFESGTGMGGSRIMAPAALFEGLPKDLYANKKW